MGVTEFENLQTEGTVKLITRMKRKLHELHDVLPDVVGPLETQLEKWKTEIKKQDDASSSVTDELREFCAYFSEAINHPEKHEYKYDNVLEKLQSVITSLSPSTLSSTPKETTITSSIIDRLPPIPLPQFDGSYMEWISFENRFSSLINQNPTLSNVERLYYLHTCLSGKAKAAIAYLNITNANYTHAWDILKTRFGNKRLIVNAYIKRILSLPNMITGSAESLYNIYYCVQGTLMALKDLGRPVDKWDDIIVCLIVDKLDFDTRKAWEEKMAGKGRNEFPTYEELMKFLDHRATLLEALEHYESFRNNHPSSPARLSSDTESITTPSVTITRIACFACQENHFIRKCRTFRSYSVEERKKLVKDANRCFNCLAINHHSTECPSEYRCRKCQEKHHTLLHPAD